jgi:hypothetical protein
MAMPERTRRQRSCHGVALERRGGPEGVLEVVLDQPLGRWSRCKRDGTERAEDVTAISRTCSTTSERDTLTGCCSTARRFDETFLRATAMPSLPGCSPMASGPDERRSRQLDRRHWLGVIDIDHFKLRQRHASATSLAMAIARQRAQQCHAPRRGPPPAAGSRCPGVTPAAGDQVHRPRQPGRVDQLVGQAGQLRQVAADEACPWASNFSLWRHRVEDAEVGLRIAAAGGRPLPAAVVGGQVKVVQVQRK